MANQSSPLTPQFSEFSLRVFIGTVIAGVVTGLVTVGGGRLLNHFIFSRLSCEGANQLICSSSDSLALHIAAVIAVVLAVIILAGVRAYRPLLIAILVTAGLWQFSTLTLGLTWPWATLILILANIVTYLAFGWLLRIYNLAIAVGLSVLLVAVMLFISYSPLFKG